VNANYALIHVPANCCRRKDVMKDALSNAEIGDFIVGDNGRIYQVSDCEMGEMLLTRIANDRQRLIQMYLSLQETVDIYKPCPVCCGDGDSKDVDCPTCNNVGFLWES